LLFNLSGEPELAERWPNGVWMVVTRYSDVDLVSLSRLTSRPLIRF
jgi:hypothetical protein